MAVKMRYSTTNQQKETEYFRNIVELSRFLETDNATCRKILNTSRHFKGYQLEEFKKPIVLETPKIGDIVTIQNIKCEVINVYGRTLSVKTKFGNRLVMLKNMKFVGTVIENIDRTMPLTTRKL
ncbi:hypothetical protein [Vagococcus carniphilus]|uniref:hypothetical protein n=1 Tax=Vagococcus carniphilus TaxID=218144 RepID=UPI003BAAF0F5